MTTLLSTSFAGSNDAVWPSPWTIVGGSGSIQSNRGELVSPAGAWSGGEASAGLTVPTGRIVATVRFPSIPNRSARINVRWNAGSGNGYRLIIPTDYNGFQLVKVIGYSETPLDEEFVSSWVANTNYKVAVEWTGSTIRARRWLASATEPLTWDLTATDTTYTTGDVSLVVVNNGSGGAQNVLWDDVLITDTLSADVVVPSGDGARVTFHDDAIQAPFGDYGTWTTFTTMSEADTRVYAIAQIAAGAPFGGESAVVNAPDTLGPAFTAELEALHVSFLNPDYQADVWNGLTSDEIDDVTRRLGYRLRLTTASLPSTVVAGASFSISLTFTNDGYARTYRARPTRLVFVNGSTVVTRTLAFDIRSVTPGSTMTLVENVTAPAEGEWAMYLLFPDPTTELQTISAYSIQLANVGTWDSATGRNSLNHSLVVGP